MFFSNCSSSLLTQQNSIFALVSTLFTDISFLFLCAADTKTPTVRGLMKAGPVGSLDYGENDQRWEQDMSTEEDLMKDFSLRRV